MATKSNTTALEAARARWRRATAACPHWDYEGNGSGHACCDELDAAELALDDAHGVSAIAEVH
jgi:hypothetical protein